MYEGNVQLVQQRCTTCDYHCVQPQVDRHHDRFSRETVVEATWVCPRCGNRFASGIVERIPDEAK